MRSFLRYMLLSLVLVAVALISAVITMSLAIHGHEVAVPDLVGKTPAEARRLAAGNGLELSIERQYYSGTVPEGRILSQLPPAGTKVRGGWELRAAESLGPQRVDIPNVLGESERAAQMNIERRGLDVGAIAQMQLSNAAADQVVSQSPPPNASDVAAPKISLLVAEPAQPQAFIMPSFLGMPVGTATQTVQDAGLSIGTVTVAGQPIPAPASAAPANSAAIPPAPVMPAAVRPSAGSIIVSQTPAAGEKVLVGSPVSFQVK
jgi:eukaryotic-like serine/threonine-protein kinase